MSNRIAIVTGASRGIGRATAIRLAKDFGGVVLVARSTDLLEQTAEAVRSAGAEPLSLGADLRTPAAAKEAVADDVRTYRCRGEHRRRRSSGRRPRHDRRTVGRRFRSEIAWRTSACHSRVGIA
jgi:NAD(P)-dependent dehydrogenase (short-subunit alcohol dehydrogenase family)